MAPASSASPARPAWWTRSLSGCLDSCTAGPAMKTSLDHDVLSVEMFLELVGERSPYNGACNVCSGMKRMEYKGRQWHEDCFICSSCKKNIGDNSFFPSGSDIHCSSCYEESFSVKCTGCSKAIISGGITYRGQPWHRQCFTCTHCNQSLAGLSFTTRDDKQYCTHCVTQLFSRPCSTCSEPVGTGGTRFVSFEGRHWHSSCFTCTSCFSSLVDKGFIAEEKEILCIDCARMKMEEESFEYE